MKSLFKEKSESFSAEAEKLKGDILKVTKPIMEAYAEDGYSMRSISHVAQDAISFFEYTYILSEQIRKGFYTQISKYRGKKNKEEIQNEKF